MKAASAQEIKKELKALPAGKLVDLCLRLARFKKENKELLTYLLFEASDEESYVKSVKAEMDEAFSEVNIARLYQGKKTLRKILRTTNKYIRYSDSATTEVELLLYYCESFRDTKVPFHKSAALAKLYDGQIKKVATAIDSLHEDLQHDYRTQLNKLTRD
jgi:hypothetical protein